MKESQGSSEALDSETALLVLLRCNLRASSSEQSLHRLDKVDQRFRAKFVQPVLLQARRVESAQFLKKHFVVGGGEGGGRGGGL